jgi:PAS domain S-box-containing protein
VIFMVWQYTPFIIPLLFAIVVLIVIILAAWQYRQTPAGRVFIWFVFDIIWWSLTYALEVSSVTLPDKLFWLKAKYIGVSAMPLLWLSFTAAYTGRENWLTRQVWLMLAVVPIVSLLLVMTTEYQPLFYSDFSLVDEGGYTLLSVGHGIWFFVYMAYSYAILLVGTLLIGQALIHAAPPYRAQIGVVMLATIVPWIVNVLAISRLIPLPNVDLTTFGFTITSILISLSLFRFRLLNLTPVAYNTVVESMNDGVIVLDATDRIVDLNPAAHRMIGIPELDDVIGQPAAQVLARWPNMIERYLHASDTVEELVLGEGDARRYYDLHISYISTRGSQRIGRLIVLNDITTYINTKNALQISEARLRAFTDALPDPAFICDEDGQYVEAIIPENVPPIPGIADLRGHYFHEALSPSITEQLLTATRNTIQTGQFNSLEYVVNLPSGDMWFEGRLAPMRSLPDQKGLAVLIARDITARRQAEAAVRRLSAQLDDLLHRFVPRTVADTMIADPDTVHLGGARREVTVLFADLRGFTHWSENHDPEQVIDMLNHQMAVGIEAVLAENGTLDKIMGDALMAVFNTPQEQPDHALRAIRAAQAMLAAPHPEGIPHFSIGINTGMAVAGNVGTERVMNYTVIGDAVNQAKRLQEMAWPGQALMSKDTYIYVKDQIATRYIGQHQLRGREIPTDIYQLIDNESILPHGC